MNALMIPFVGAGPDGVGRVVRVFGRECGALPCGGWRSDG